MAGNTPTTSQLVLHTPSNAPLSVEITSLRCLTRAGEVVECCLTFQVPFALYRRIDEDRLFNLAPEVRGPVYNGALVPGPDVQLEAILQPSVLPRLLLHAAGEDEAVAHLLEISRQAASRSALPDNVVDIFSRAGGSGRAAFAQMDPLLCTESWFCQSVEQVQDTGTVGYRTFWSYFSPSQLFEDDASGEQLAEAIIDFVRDSINLDLPETTRSALAEMAQNVGEFFEGLVARAQPERPHKTQPLFQALIEFFADDGWPFVADDEGSMLCLSFRGDNGRWTCLAEVRELHRQLVFYSLCPIRTPEDRRQAVAEFITRANYGLIIGNLELDFSDGEIRCKTSIDVEGDRISPALLEQLVYTNVSIMDEYLPGIAAVVEEGVAPKDAIARIEARF